MRTPPSEAAIRSALRVSWLSIGWTILAGAAAIVSGIAAHTLVVVVFGLTGFIDAAGSLTLVFHFRHALKHRSMSAARERFALRVVGGGLIGIGTFTLAEGSRRLIVGARTHDATLGTAIAAGSFIALVLLAGRKRVVARRIGSRALGADGLLSAVGAGLAFIAAMGSILATRRHLSWIDPASSMLLAIIAVAGGITALRKEEEDLTGES